VDYSFKIYSSRFEVDVYEDVFPNLVE